MQTTQLAFCILGKTEKIVQPQKRKKNSQTPGNGNEKAACDKLRVNCGCGECAENVALGNAVAAKDESNNRREEIERGRDVLTKAENVRGWVLPLPRHVHASSGNALS